MIEQSPPEPKKAQNQSHINDPANPDYDEKSEEMLVRIKRLRMKKELEAQKQALVDGLPHLYAWKWYSWAREFFNSRNRISLLASANQIGKSSTQIRKCIEWAGNPKLWPTLFMRRPIQFWYLYPTQDMVNSEFHTKWVAEFMPRGPFKEHVDYGWKEIRQGKDVQGIQFNSGVVVYFKTYAQNSMALQGSTLDAIFCFTANTLVTTIDGLKKIKDIRVGDLVLTKEGEYCPVVDTYSRRAPVIKRLFSNGEIIEATPDHRFWTDKGWVEFKDLTDGHLLGTLRRWKKIGKWPHTRDTNTIDFRTTQTSAEGTLEEHKKENVTGCIKKFGKIILGLFPLDMCFTTLTTIRAIMRLVIWSVCVEKSTAEDTPWKDGGKKNTPIDPTPVGTVKKCLQAEPIKSKQLSGVVGGVGHMVRGVRQRALNVKKNLTTLVRDQGHTVLTPALGPLREETVYCLNVSKNHNFFANSICVRNCDEELPVHLYDELTARLTATDGFFSMCFTATLGQEFWENAMEHRGTDRETLKHAWKKTVSMYDCLTYEDGSPTPWTLERIKRREAMCKNKEEIERRVHGRFVMDTGRKYAGFSRAVNRSEPTPIPKDWLYYCGVDLGSGGENHPAAIVYVATSPDRKKGRVFRAWRGDGIITAAGDVLEKFKELTGSLQLEDKRYDPSAPDFFTVASREGIHFQKANKLHDTGTGIVNTLFRGKMLTIDTGDPELDKLVTELGSLSEDGSKRHKKDDLCDALRYCVATIMWDYSDAVFDDEKKVKKQEKKGMTQEEWLMKARRGELPMEVDEDGINEELDAWNELYES